MRNSNSNKKGNKWTQEEIIAVWNGGIIVKGYNKDIQRKDSCNAWIKFSEYGKTDENGMGWEVDHVKPVAQGGDDELSNLQPLQWENNRHKSDNCPNWDCKKISK